MMHEFVCARVAEDEAQIRYEDTRFEAEVRAKRLILAEPDNQDVTVSALAAIYADHPDYDPRWASAIALA